VNLPVLIPRRLVQFYGKPRSNHLAWELRISENSNVFLQVQKPPICDAGRHTSGALLLTGTDKIESWSRMDILIEFQREAGSSVADARLLSGNPQLRERSKDTLVTCVRINAQLEYSYP
jgi:hypothetical protein